MHVSQVLAYTYDQKDGIKSRIDTIRFDEEDQLWKV